MNEGRGMVGDECAILLYSESQVYVQTQQQQQIGSCAAGPNLDIYWVAIGVAVSVVRERGGGINMRGRRGREGGMLCTQTYTHTPDRVEERGLLVDVIMAAELGEPVVIPDTSAAELAVWRELELSSLAIASLFSLDRRF